VVVFAFSETKKKLCLFN